MAGTLHRRFWVLLGAAAAGCGAWFLLPGTAIDRLAFSAVVRGFANPPMFISGKGSHDSPWNLRTFTAGNHADTRQAPVIVSLGDDREGLFQSSPPSPIDLAVVLNDIHRLGVKKAATAVVLAWDAPDPIGLAALDKALGRFDSLVMAAPLSRGAVPEPLPPAFREASVSVASVRGDVSALPVVNRIPLPGVILGGKNVAAGFQTLASEPGGKLAPLLARWEDRVVFAFPLLCVLQRLDLPLAGLIIRPGEAIQLGPHGPILPMDRFGRLAVPLQTLAPFAEIPAEAVVDGGESLLPHDAPGPVVLRDDRSAAEPATRAFSKGLPALIAALASNHTLAPARDYHRPQAHCELAALLLVALALTAWCILPVFPRNIAFLTSSAACLTTQCVAAGAADLWLPGLPALAAITCGWVLSGLIAATPADPLPTRNPWWKFIAMRKPAPAAGLSAPPAGVTETTTEVPPQLTAKPARKTLRKTTRITVPKATPTPEPKPERTPEPVPKPKVTRKPATKKPPPPASPEPEPTPNLAPPTPPPAVSLTIPAGKSRAPASKRKR